MKKWDALDKAREQSLDLVEIGANAKPPVCKIVDYGKYRYEQEKSKQKSKNKAGEVKEIQLGVKTDEHDFNTRVEQAKKFVEKGHKLRLTVKMQGRQNIYFENALKKIENFKNLVDLEYENEPQRFGNRYSALLIKKK
ncbi:MAG: Translation initiation factor IF-3 [candidate division WS2 bacterium ADurb.Bin280]|uniref:Translation initiation factor IF-3 n=1 Tax=candidate division WS2 bacterium ADurb.Bin280 TaxID=1852829 RepID=A0A1V5SF36_9BACT|nr:MAG: Translation initiation factor IF-3 [candidate division WS2 bacterium ADurb.Bin280]